MNGARQGVARSAAGRLSTLKAGTALGAGVLATMLTFQPAQGQSRSYADGENNAAAVNAPATLTVGSGAATQSGVVGGSGNIIKDGAGSLALTGANTFTGDLRVNGGVVAVTSEANLGAGGTVFLLGGGFTVEGPGFTTGRTFQLADTFNRISVGSAGTLTLSGFVTNDGALVKDGLGTLVLSGSNGYSGGTVVNAGTVRLGDVAALGLGGLTLAGPNTTVDLAGFSPTLPSLNADFDATRRIVNGGAGRATLTVRSGDFGGSIQGDIGLVKTGPGDLTLRGENTYTGPTTVRGGTLEFRGSGPGPIVVPTSSVTLDGGGMLLRGGRQDILISGGLNVLQNSTIDFQVQFCAPAGRPGSFGNPRGSLSFNGPLTGSGTLRTTGVGPTRCDSPPNWNLASLSLNGDLSAFTGQIEVGQSSRLNINSRLEQGVVLSDVGVIGGSGTIVGGLSGVRAISPGQSRGPGSTGTLTLGSLDQSLGGTTQFELRRPGVVGGGVNDLIRVTGTLGGASTGNATLGGSLDVIGAEGGRLESGVYTLLTYDGTLSGSWTLDQDYMAQNNILPANAFLRTSTLGQVDLVILTGSRPHQFWDGPNNAAGNVEFGRGGTGGWEAQPVGGTRPMPTNWTNFPGSANASWPDNPAASDAIFAGVRGEVTVLDAPVFNTIQFLTDGYRLVANFNEFGPQPSLVISTDTNVAANERGLIIANGGVTATIDVNIDGGNAETLRKGGTGSLIINGLNTQLNTVVDAGVLEFGRSAALGAPGLAGKTLTVNARGTLRYLDRELSSFADGRLATYDGAVVLAGADATIDVADIFVRPADAAAPRLILSGAISGAGGLTKIGTGTLQLDTASTYAGATTVNAGGLDLNAAGALPSTTVLTIAQDALVRVLAGDQTVAGLNGAGGLQANAAAVFTVNGGGSYSGNTVGALTLAKSGPGTLTLSGRQFNTGGARIDGGTLALDGQSTLGPGNITFGGGALVALTSRALEGNVTNASGSVINLAAAAGATLTIPTGVGVNGASGSIVINGGGETGTVSLEGGRDLNPIDAAVSVSLNAGRLRFRNGSIGDIAANAGSSLSLLANTVLELADDGAFVTINQLVGAGSSRITASGLGNQRLVIGGQDSNGGVDSTFNGVIENGTGRVTLEKRLAGTLTLGGANTYSGGTVISGGAVRLGRDNAIGTGGLTFAASNTLFDMAGFNQTLASLDAPVDPTRRIANLTFNTLSTLTVSGGDFGGSIAASGPGAGDVRLVKTGPGTLTLRADPALSGDPMSYGGGTQLDGGTMALVNIAAQGSGAITMAGGTTLDVGRSGGMLITDIVLAGAATIDTGAESILHTGAVSGAGSLIKTGAGGLALFGGPNSYSGGTQLREGLIAVGSADALGTGAVTLAAGTTLEAGLTMSNFVAGGLTLANAIAIEPGGATIDPNGLITQLDGVVSGGPATFASSNVAGLSAVVLTAANTYSATNIGPGTIVQAGLGGVAGAFGSGPINLGGAGAQAIINRSDTVTLTNVITGVGQFTQAGPGTTILTGANGPGQQFNGVTAVLAGTLRVNGVLGDTAGNAMFLQVQSGGRLEGTGRIAGGAEVLSGGTLAAGASPGTLTIGSDLGLASGSTTVFELNSSGIAGGSTNDLIRVGGNLIVQAGAGLNVSSVLSGYYRLFDVAGSGADSAANFTVTAGPGVSAELYTIAAPGNSQVNLLVRISGQFVQFWDGADQTGGVPPGAPGAGVINGGTGAWAAANTNWVQGPLAGGQDINDRWRGGVAVFGGAGSVSAGGVVTLSGTVGAQGLQFASDGYVLTGGGLTLTGNAPAGQPTASFVLVDAGVSARIDSAIGGAGVGLTKLGGGTMTLSGLNTYSGLTTVSAGTLVNAGLIAGAVQNNATFSNAAGAIVQGGLTNAANASNAGTINAGVVNTAALTTTGVINGGLVNAGTVNAAGQINGPIANNAGAITLTAALTGTGAFTQSAGATLDLAGNDAAFGSLAGAGSVTLGAGRLTTGADGSSTTFAGVMSGDGGLTKTGAGVFTLTGANTYAGVTRIEGGALRIGAGGLTGSIAGNVENAGALIVDRAGDITFAGAISGSGQLEQRGGGVTRLTGANTYGGGTLVSGGRLVVSPASLPGDVTNNAALEFDAPTNGVYAGAMSGSGLLDKTGAGRLTLTGASAGLTGPTTILAGELMVNGNLGGSVVMVASGATLSGVGTVGAVVARAGGTVAPGNSPGTLTVNGDVSFLSGSTYAVEIRRGVADRITASGAATIAGAMAVNPLGGPYVFYAPYIVLSAQGGVTGQFTTTGLERFGRGIDTFVDYTATTVAIRLEPKAIGPIVQGLPLTQNQTNTVLRIDEAILSGGYDPTPLLPLFLLAQAEYPAALDALSGEAHATGVRIALDDERLVREATLGRLRQQQDDRLTPRQRTRSDAAVAAAGFDPSAVGLWGQGFGSLGRFASDGNGASFERRVGGFVIGADVGARFGQIAGGWRLGAVSQYVQSTFTSTARGSTGTVTRIGGGVYGALDLGQFNARFGATLASLDIETARSPAFSGFADSTSSSSRGGAVGQLFGEVGYALPISARAVVEPFAAASVTQMRTRALTEQGGPAALAVAAGVWNVGAAQIGVRGRAVMTLPSGHDLTLNAALGYRMLFGDTRPATLNSLAAAPAFAFPIYASGSDRGAAVAELGLSTQVGESLRVGVSYSGVIGRRTGDHAIKGDIGWQF